MTAPVVLFTFAGRRPNMELQLRWATEVLVRYPEVEYHVWNLARDPADGEWLRGLPCCERMTVRNDFAHLRVWDGMRLIWNHYADHSEYQDTVLVKVDDDVVFLDPARFGLLAAYAMANPTAVVSADVVNNGACNALHPELAVDGCGPLEVHAWARCADISHTWFLDNWRTALVAPVTPRVPTTWCSINAIALTHPVASRIASMVGSGCPPVIAGFAHGQKVTGDEGAANQLPRLILGGVMAAHLTFGPQAADPYQLKRWRDGYAVLFDELLGVP